MRHRPAKTGEAGFTLLELMVAMTLLAMIGAAAAGGVSFGVAVWERGSGIAEAGIEERLVQKFLRRQIEGAALIRIRDGSRNPPALFAGSRDRLELAAPLPAALAPPGTHLVALDLVAGTEAQGTALQPQTTAAAAAPGGSGLALRLRWVRIGQTRPSLDRGAAQEILMQDLSNMRLRYFGTQAGGGAPGWQEDWTGRGALPDLVEITLIRADGRTLPPVIARLRGAAL